MVRRADQKASLKHVCKALEPQFNIGAAADIASAVVAVACGQRPCIKSAPCSGPRIGRSAVFGTFNPFTFRSILEDSIIS